VRRNINLLDKEVCQWIATVDFEDPSIEEAPGYISSTTLINNLFHEVEAYLKEHVIGCVGVILFLLAVSWFT